MHLFVARHLISLFKLQNITQEHFPKVSAYSGCFIRQEVLSYNDIKIPIFIFAVLSQYIITHIMPPHVKSPVTQHFHTNFIIFANSIASDFSHFIIYYS